MNSDPEEYQKLLAQLAALKGIEPEYQDVWGNLHSISPEITLKILSAMGCQVDSLEKLKKEVLSPGTSGLGTGYQACLDRFPEYPSAGVPLSDPG